MNSQGFRKTSMGCSSAAIALSAAILFAAPAQAQDTSGAPAEETAKQAGDIIVTAGRREESLVNVPSAVTAIDNASAIANGITDINGIADLVPNLKATDGGSPSLGNLTIRGIFTGGSPTVGTYVDDVPFGPVVGGAGTSLALDASLFDLQRIEVARGPQGTLFGAGAVGGIVRYVTAAPSLNKFDGYALGDVSFTRHGDPNYIVRGRLSAPIVHGKLGVSVSGFYNKAGGYIDHPARGATDVDGWKYYGGLASATFKPTEDFTIRANALHQEAKFNNASYEGFNSTTGQPILGHLTDITQVPSPRTLNYDLYYLTADYDFGAATLTSVTSQQRLEFTTLSDLTASFGPLADLFAPLGAPHTAALDASFGTSRFTQEVRLTSKKNESFEWILGAYYTAQKTSETQRVIINPADVNLIDVTSPIKYKEVAAFGNATFYISPKWDVTGGIRIARNTTTVRQIVAGLLVPPSNNAAANQAKDTVATYLFNTRYRVSPAFNLYARVASGYRPGGSNLVTLDPLGQPLGQPSYSADQLWTYEVGAKGTVLGDKIVYDVNFYYIDWKDAQVSVRLANGLGGTSNAAGKIRASGFEASLSGELTDGLVISGTLAIGDTELQRDEPNLGGLRGERLPGNPKSSASLLADYSFDLSSAVKASMGATWRYSGSSTTTFNGGTGSGGGVIAPSIPNYTNGNYSQFDIRAGLNFGHFAVNAYVTNLFDSRAYQTVFPIAPGYAEGVVLRPRTIGLNVRAGF